MFGYYVLAHSRLYYWLGPFGGGVLFRSFGLCEIPFIDRGDSYKLNMPCQDDCTKKSSHGKKWKLVGRWSIKKQYVLFTLFLVLMCDCGVVVSCMLILANIRGEYFGAKHNYHKMAHNMNHVCVDHSEMLKFREGELVGSR